MSHTAHMTIPMAQFQRITDAHIEFNSRYQQVAAEDDGIKLECQYASIVILTINFRL